MFAGKSIEVFLIPTEAGVFDLVCLIEGHFEQGMFGTITVVAVERSAPTHIASAETPAGRSGSLRTGAASAPGRLRPSRKDTSSRRSFSCELLSSADAPATAADMPGRCRTCGDDDDDRAERSASTGGARFGRRRLLRVLGLGTLAVVPLPVLPELIRRRQPGRGPARAGPRHGRAGAHARRADPPVDDDHRPPLVRRLPEHRPAAAVHRRLHRGPLRARADGVDRGLRGAICRAAARSSSRRPASSARTRRASTSARSARRSPRPRGRS